MNGQEMINQALIRMQSEGSRMLETGITLQDFLVQCLDTTCEDITAAWPFEWSVRTPEPIQAIAGNSGYQLPARIVEVIDIILDTGSIDTRKLIKRPLRTFKTKWAALQYLPFDKPTEWAQVNDTGFLVAPIPDSSLYTMSVTGTLKANEVSLTDGYTFIPVRDHEAIVYGLAMRGAEALRDPALKEDMTKRYGQLIQRMIQEDKRMPDVEYQLAPFRGQPVMFSTAYWANPSVRSM